MTAVFPFEHFGKFQEAETLEYENRDQSQVWTGKNRMKASQYPRVIITDGERANTRMIRDSLEQKT